jgi:hypothetical protein
VILLPKYTEDVLEISTEDTVYVAAPAAMARALGLVLAPPLSRGWARGGWLRQGSLCSAGADRAGARGLRADFIQSNLDLGLASWRTRWACRP